MVDIAVEGALGFLPFTQFHLVVLGLAKQVQMCEVFGCAALRGKVLLQVLLGLSETRLLLGGLRSPLNGFPSEARTVD